MELDLGAQPVTDVHCFSFAARARLTRRSLADLFLSGGPTVKGFRGEVREDDMTSSVAYRRMIHGLSRLLKTKDDDMAVLARRSELAQDFGAYVRMLFEDAGIEAITLDNGIEPVSYGEFQKYASCGLRRIFRLEPLIKHLLSTSDSFRDLCDSFETTLVSAVKKQGFVGFKSVAAYRTGLDVGNPTESEALRSFGERRGQKEWFGPKVKPLRDFLLRAAAEKARRLEGFLQIHTGVGDTDVVADKCDPLLLKDFLKLDEVSRTPVILIHGGFPYTQHAAWLANVFPNVYFELSTPLPPIFIPALSKARFGDVLEMVPLTRIVYGSDAIEIPENHWMSATLAKSALGAALGELISSKAFDERQARKAGRLILNDNAAKLIGS